MKRVMSRTRPKAPTSKSLDDFSSELHYGGDRATILSLNERIRQILAEAGVDPEVAASVDAERAAKKNYAQRLSEAVAQKTADGLRPKFKGILPDESGGGRESNVHGAAGLKRIDVNYMTPQMGLGLAVSIKTCNFADSGSGRFTKNLRRIDGELRAEAEDVHARQPYAVLAGIILMPREATMDGSKGVSSAGHAKDVFRRRAGRKVHDDAVTLFERLFIGIYETDVASFGAVEFFDVLKDTDFRKGGGALFSAVLKDIEVAFLRRNQP